MEYVAAIAFVLLMAAALVWDVATRRIPNRLVLTGLALGLVLRGLAGWPALGSGLAGMGVALLIMVPLFALRAVGGGDAKLVAVTGAFLGVGGLFVALLASAIIGGVLGVGIALRKGVILPVLLAAKDLAVHGLTLGRAGERVTIDSPGAVTVPYGAAIAVGSVFAWFQAGGVPW